MPNAPRSYTREEMQEILRRAMDRQSSRGEITHDEMVDAAREVGIDVDSIEQAAHELDAHRASVDEDAEVARRKKRGFYRSLVVYGVVNTALFALDMLTAGGRWWFAVAIIWGIFVALHGVSVFMPRHESPEERQRRLEQRVRHEARRREQEARRAVKRARHEAKLARKEAIRRGAEQFEDAVEQGVALLLGGIAKQVQRGVDAARDRGPGPLTVDRDDAALRSAGLDRVAPPAVRVRVEPSGRPDDHGHHHDDEEPAEVPSRREQSRRK